MKNITTSMILTAFAIICYVGLLVSIPVRAKKMLSSAGKLVEPLAHASCLHPIAIFVACAVIIAIVPLRNFAMYITVIFLMCSLLGTHIAARSVIGAKYAGIYENLIVTGSELVYFDDIYALPTLSYENDSETTMVDKTTIQVLRQNGATVTLLFGSEEARKNALDKILELVPRLKVSN